MKTKWTPGPLDVSGLGEEYLTIETVATPVRFVARVYRKSDNVPELEAVANAHLFALAPEMAEALRFFVTVIKRNDAPLTASMEYAHAVKLLVRLEGGEK